MRDHGYYWVFVCHKWRIAFFNGCWFCNGFTPGVDDGFFDSIDERRIVREVE